MPSSPGAGALAQLLPNRLPGLLLPGLPGELKGHRKTRPHLKGPASSGTPQCPQKAHSAPLPSDTHTGEGEEEPLTSIRPGPDHRLRVAPLPPISTPTRGADQVLRQGSCWIRQAQDSHPEALRPHGLPPSSPRFLQEVPCRPTHRLRVLRVKEAAPQPGREGRQARRGGQPGYCSPHRLWPTWHWVTKTKETKRPGGGEETPGQSPVQA